MSGQLPLIDADRDLRYQLALRRLSERGRFGIRLGLGRTRALLRRLGNPQEGLPGVLITGTNGKGSVQALVAAAIRRAGYRTGQTPKPHLLSYRERILVDGEPIGAGDFAEIIERVLDEAAAIERRVGGPPTEFEVLTAAAFAWFARCSVELGVIEVGMGGRLDATNTWQGGLSAVTNVALDHMEQLGQTLEAIAGEKAQIIKRGDHRALTGADEPALAVIARRARRVRVPLQHVRPLGVQAVERSGTLLRTSEGEELRVGLLGRHQAQNAALALAIIEAFNETGMARVSREQLRDAFARARWPGRLELLPLDQGQSSGAELLLDGAHNPHGSAALAATLDELRPQLAGGRPTLLIGVLRDKDVAGVLEPLLRSASLARAAVLTTCVPDSPRSLSADELAAAWQATADRLGLRRTPPTPVADTAEAVDRAAAAARTAGGLLLVCGSLYLVGYVRGRLAGSVPLTN